MRTATQVQAILRNVQDRLDARHRATGLELQVPPDGFVEDEDWLNIVVTPAAPGVRAYEYVDALGEIERELRASGVDHVLLVPALAD